MIAVRTPTARWSLAVLVFVLFSTGCSRLEVLAAQQATYSASVHVSLSDDRILGAVRRALTRLGWRVVPAGSRPWRVTALRNETPEMRDVAIIDVGSRGDLEVRVRTEMSNGAGGWITPVGVCDQYTFARERQIVERVEASARRIERRAGRTGTNDAGVARRQRNHE